MAEQKYFTVVFEGDIGKMKANPFHIDSAWGRPVTIGKGDLLAEMDRHFEEICSRSSVGSEHRTSNSAVAGSSPAGNANSTTPN